MTEMTREEAFERLRVMARAFMKRDDPAANEIADEIDRCADALEAPAHAKVDRDAEERRAWDMYAAGLKGFGALPVRTVAEMADALLEARRARFPKGGA